MAEIKHPINEYYTGNSRHWSDRNVQGVGGVFTILQQWTRLLQVMTLLMTLEFGRSSATGTGKLYLYIEGTHCLQLTKTK